MKDRPGLWLSYVEQLREYQLLLTEMILRVDPRFKKGLRAEVGMVEEQIRRLLSTNPAAVSHRATFH